MSKLIDIQNGFQHYLLTGEIKDVLPAIVEDHLPREKRLKIYFDAYWLRLLDITQQDYSKTLVLLGEEKFEQAFLAYLKAYPSKHFSARYFGQYFSQFLKDCSPYSDYPMLSEMANFEWSLMSTLDAADAPLISQAELNTLPENAWSSLKLSFHPSVILRKYQWDTPFLWKSIEANEPQRQPILLEEPQDWLIWRKGLRSLYHSISPTQALLFKSMNQGLCFHECLEKLNEIMEEAEIPAFAISNLQFWIHSEMVSGMSYSQDNKD